MIERQALEAMDRESLLAEAHRHGVKRAEVMTRVELTDEILRLGTPNPVERKEVRGWLGVARDLVASIVDRGLNLPDAAAVIRGDARFDPLKRPHAPVATVTLAEIYGAQGHYTRAIAMLDEVLDKEPDHHVARRLRDRLELVSSHKAPPFSPENPADLVAAAPVDGTGAGSEPFFAFEDDEAGDEDDDDTAATLSPANGAGHTAVLSPVNGAAHSAPSLDEDGTLSTLPPLEGGPVTDDDTMMAVAPEEPIADAAESPDEEGNAVTLPPREPAAPAVDETDHGAGFDDDEDGTAATLPPLAPDPDEDGTAVTIPPSKPAAIEPEGSLAGDEEAPKTLAPERLEMQDELPTFTHLEPPVRRVAPSDVDWEPLPQTEFAPKIALPAEELDSVIVLRTGPSTASLYFELASAPSDAAVLRVVELRPRRTFAERVERELPVTSKGGLVTVEDLEQGSIVRAAIGVREGDLFRALAVAAEVRATGGGPEIVWAPRKEADYGAVAQKAALVLPQLRP